MSVVWRDKTGGTQMGNDPYVFHSYHVILATRFNLVCSPVLYRMHVFLKKKTCSFTMVRSSIFDAEIPFETLGPMPCAFWAKIP